MPTRTFFKIAYEADDLAEAQGQLARAHRIAHVEPKPITLTPGELEAVVVATIERLGLSVNPPEDFQGGKRRKVAPPRAKKPRSGKKKVPPQGGK